MALRVGPKQQLKVTAQGVIHSFHGIPNAKVGKARHPVSGDAARHDAAVVRQIGMER